MSQMFSELLDMANQQDEPQRLLFLFTEAEGNKKASKANGKNPQRGLITPKMCVDKLPSELGDYKDLVKEADSINSDWDFVFIAGLSGQNGKPPSSEEADQYLNKMTNDVASGQNIARYVVFDREGNPIELMVN